MNKNLLIVGGTIVIIAFAIFFILQGEQSVSMNQLDSDITEVEDRLETIDQRLIEDDVSAEEAQEVRALIFDQLGSIQTQVTEARAEDLSESERSELQATLVRLQNMLERYANTLNLLDEVAGME